MQMRIDFHSGNGHLQYRLETVLFFLMFMLHAKVCFCVVPFFVSSFAKTVLYCRVPEEHVRGNVSVGRHYAQRDEPDVRRRGWRLHVEAAEQSPLHCR